MALLVLKVRLRKNQVNGAQSVSVNNAQTGLFEDAINTDAFIAADEVDYLQDTTTDATSGTVLSDEISVLFENTDVDSFIKTFNGLARASAKSVYGLALASVKTWNGLT